MSASKNMTVSVGGIDITIQTDEDRGYIQKLAAKVDEKVGTYLRMGAKVTVAQAAVLTAMELCDEFEKNNAAVENMRAQMRSYIDDYTHRHRVLGCNWIGLWLLRWLLWWRDLQQQQSLLSPDVPVR
jgi:cell division protein ZapA (FtsZ GTPase activity inhibitor)